MAVVSGNVYLDGVELGHASDTTVTRRSAGRIDVEGVELMRATRVLNAQTGTTYTLQLSDAGALVMLNNASAVTLTIPTNASVAFPAGTEIHIAQTGAGQVTVGGSGVSIRATPGTKLSAQYASARLIYLGSDTWLLTGSLSA